MRIHYAVAFLLISCGLMAQSYPVAVNDSAQVMNQKVVAIPVLENDYDPDGDSIIISRVYSANYGEEWYNDTLVYYKSDWHVGWDDVRYRIEKKHYPTYESDRAYIHIEVLENPDVPVAVNDTFSILRLETYDVDILINDSDPNGDDFKINEVSFNDNHLEVIYSSDSSFVVVTSKHSTPEEFYFKYDNIERGTQDSYLSNQARVHLIIEDNPDIPIAVNDTFAATGGTAISFDVLSNDNNPLNDTLEIYDLENASHGMVSLSGNTVQYSGQLSYAGPDSFEYRIRYKNKPWLYSLPARVDIDVIKNPDCPIGDPDYAEGMAYTYIPVMVLENDHDPNGDEFEIKDVFISYPSFGSSIEISGGTVIYRPQPGKVGADSCFYRIMKSNAPEYYSEWIPIRYNIEWNPGYPKTFPDSVTVKGGQEVLIDFRSNDIVQDSLVIHHISTLGSKLGRTELYSDSLILYKAYSGSSGRDTIQYSYKRFGPGIPFESKGEIYVDIINSHAYDSLNINNINAGFNASGMQFCKIDELLNEGTGINRPHFEAPKGSQKHAIYNYNLWLGGVNDTGQIHLAANMFRWNGTDFQPGPIYDGEYDTTFFNTWNRIWNLSASDIHYHYHNWWKEGYEPIEPIASWPGNGDGNGMAEQLAPYHDKDGNGFYDPMAGDYPLIRGNQCLYFITNDAKFHEETQGAPMLAEVHWMAYAFDNAEDSLLKNTIFLHYDIINRSANTYTDTYMGFFTAHQLGYSWDNRIGSDVMGNSYYGYNGEDQDGSGDPDTYGEHPPAISTTVLAGPYIDPDMEDNPSGACDHSLLGLNFGNGMIDDERYGLNYFMYFHGGAGSQGYPAGYTYYTYMKGLWKDESELHFGGDGHFEYGGVGPRCRYYMPGDSDPYNWGTNCVLPNDGYNQDGKYWTEEQVGYLPGSRLSVGSCGPFTFKPGDVQELDLAFVFAQSYHSADSSKALLHEMLAELRQRILDGEILVPNNELNINENPGTRNEIHIYPNPTRETIYIKGAEELVGAEYRIYNMMGTVIQRGKISAEINIAGLQKGFYIISIISGNSIYTGKFIKH